MLFWFADVLGGHGLLCALRGEARALACGDALLLCAARLRVCHALLATRTRAACADAVERADRLQPLCARAATAVSRIEQTELLLLLLCFV